MKQAYYVRFVALEIATKNKPEIDISTLLGVQRNILVRCPAHGEKILTISGHHIDPPFEFAGAKVGGRWQTRPGRKKK